MLGNKLLSVSIFRRENPHAILYQFHWWKISHSWVTGKFMREFYFYFEFTSKIDKFDPFSTHNLKMAAHVFLSALMTQPRLNWKKLASYDFT